MTLAFLSTDLLWRNALAAVPLAIAVALLCRCLPCRPSTRHALWLIALLSLVAPPLWPGYDLSFLAPAISGPDFVSHSSARDRMTVAPYPSMDEPSVPENFRDSAVVESLLQSLFDMTEAAAQSIQTTAAMSGPAEWKPAAPDSLTASPAEVCAQWPGIVVASPQPDAAPPPQRRVAQVEREDLHADHTSINAAAAPTLATSERHAAAPPAAHEDSSVNHNPVESQASSPDAASSIRLRQWFAGLLAVRDAIVQVTPIPAAIWLGGCALIALVLAIRTMRFRRRLNHATAAPERVIREVACAAREIGLRTPPLTLMSEARLSPMIWCGWRRVLLLPQSLWQELDADGRRAVLFHELAHLRRRDHWVRWAELVIGCLYWWHPAAWFIRKKLRDEADLCCDAWVVSLLPGGRTLYARALVTTRQYISKSSSATPAVGLGVASNQTKRFARRLTMVMTEQSAPRLSAIGGAMTLCLATVAWMAAPLWACPPETKKDRESETAKAMKLEAMRAAELRYMTPRLAVPAQPGPGADASTYEKFMVEREHAMAPHGEAPIPRGADRDPFGDPDIHSRLDRLEERLNRLTEQLEQLTAQPRGLGGARLRTPSPIMTIPRTPAPPSSPAPPAPPSTGTSYFVAPGSGGGVQAYLGGVAAGASPSVVTIQGDNGEIITRIYQLPAGKREALYTLMARSDVPVRVSSAGGGISVQGTERQHEAFRSFVVLIDPDGATAQASGLHSYAVAAQAPAEVLRAYAARAQQQANKALTAERQHQAQTMQRAIQSRQGEMERRIRDLSKKAEELTRKARELEKQSSKLQSQAEVAENEPTRQDLYARAAAIAAQAEACNDQADAQRDQIESIVEMIDSMREELADALASLDDVHVEFDEAALQEAIDAAAEAASEQSSEAIDVMPDEAAESPEAPAEDDNGEQPR